MTRVIDLLLSTDDAYAMQLAVTLRSAGETLAPESRIRAHVLTDGLSAAHRERVKASLTDLPIALRWVTVDAALFRGAVSLGGYSGVPATYFRLLLDRCLPLQVERVIYLDLDLLVLRDLSALLLAAQNAPFAAVRIKPSLAAMLGFTPNECPDAAVLGAFNAGVLVIDRVWWREHDHAARVLSIARKYRERFRHWDQDALNLALAKQWTPLPPEWNVRPDPYGFPSWRPGAEPDEPAILHFAGPRKPWHSVSDYRETSRYFEIVDRTAWAGWRPPRPSLSARLWDHTVARGHRRLDRLAESIVKARRSSVSWVRLARRVCFELAKRPWMLVTYGLYRIGRPVY